LEAKFTIIITRSYKYTSLYMLLSLHPAYDLHHHSFLSLKACQAYMYAHLIHAQDMYACICIWYARKWSCRPRVFNVYTQQICV